VERDRGAPRVAMRRDHCGQVALPTTVLIASYAGLSSALTTTKIATVRTPG
jgi:hypothetical protein